MLCRSVIPPGKLPLSFSVKDVEPSDDPLWRRATPQQRQRFWTIAGRIANEVKQRELAKGLDYNGVPLRPVSVRLTRYKSGEMLDGPALMPHRAISRTRRLLRYIVQRTQVKFYWAMNWGKILDYHRRGAVLMRGGKCVGRLPVRNVFGISKKGMAEIERRAYLEWTNNIPHVPNRIHPVMTQPNLSIDLPRDTGRPQVPSAEQLERMGLRISTAQNKNRIVNAATAPTGPVIQYFDIKDLWKPTPRKRKAAKP